MEVRTLLKKRQATCTERVFAQDASNKKIINPADSYNSVRRVTPLKRTVAVKKYWKGRQVQRRIGSKILFAQTAEFERYKMILVIILVTKVR